MGTDPSKSQKFYADVFGWKLGDPAPELGNYAMVDGASAGLSGGIGSEGPGGRVRTTFFLPAKDPIPATSGVRSVIRQQGLHHQRRK
jgi:predicted enzyme related to lactoylglutathione lyase